MTWGTSDSGYCDDSPGERGDVGEEDRSKSTIELRMVKVESSKAREISVKNQRPGCSFVEEKRSMETSSQLEETSLRNLALQSKLSQVGIKSFITYNDKRFWHSTEMLNWLWAVI